MHKDPKSPKMKNHVQQPTLLWLFLTCIAILPSRSVFAQFEKEFVLPSCEGTSLTHLDDEVKQHLTADIRYLYSIDLDTLVNYYCYAKSKKDTYIEAFILNRLGQYYGQNMFDIDSFRKMIGYMEKSMDISRKHKYYDAYLSSLELMTSTFTSNQIYGQAEAFANEFITIAETMNDSTKIAEGYMLKGRLLRETNQYHEAENYLKQAIKHYKKNSAHADRVNAFTYLHLGSLYRKAGRTDEAIDAILHGLKYLPNITYQKEFIQASLNMELIANYLERDINNFEPYLEPIKSYLNQVNSGWMTAQLLYYEGRIAEKNDNYKQAIKKYSESMEQSYKANTTLHTIEVNKALIPLLLEHNGSKEQLNRANELVQQTAMQMANHVGLENMFKVTYYKLKSEENENKYLEQTIKRNKRIISFILSIIILLIILSLMIVQKSKERKQYNKQLNQLNKALSAQNVNLQDSKQKLKDNRDELQVELKEKILTLTSYSELTQKLQKKIQANKELNSAFKRELLLLVNDTVDQETIDDINLKFLELNDDYLSVLSSHFPELTSNNLKLAMYLKMNLSSKEIAQILHKSVNTVKVARSRLRKKLNIEDPTVNLTTFLNSLDY